MATAPSRTSGPLVVDAWGGDDGKHDSKSERYLAKRLAAAGADFKGVAFVTFLLGAAVAAVVWVACGIVLEHWAVPGGLPRWARWAWLVSGLTALVAASLRWLLPLVRYRVNLVYAARVIEEEHPELHNDLVNTVLVKASPEGNAAAVVRSLERRAAKRLSATPVEAVIDRSKAVRLACALAVLVIAACLYGVFAPKSMLASAVRLVAPWARIAAPTRVSLGAPALRWQMPGEAAAKRAANALAEPPDDGRAIVVDGGAATLVRGRQLVVTTTINGLRRDERPEINVVPVPDKMASAGRQAVVPWRAEMVRAGGEAGRGVRYSAVIPDPSRGLDQSVEFTILAGDVRSDPIRVAVVDSPTLLVREVRYEFPEYMHREGETVAWQGDLRAVEGTRVVLVTESNQPLDAAWIDFDCDGRRDLKLKVGASDLARATGSFVLSMNADRTAAEHGSYRLLFQSRGAAPPGRERLEEERLEHRIEVLPDLAPEVSIEEPRESPVRVPAAAPVPVRVRALDPDFGLARVGIEVRLRGAADRGAAVQPEIVLARSNRRGEFVGVAEVVPERYGAIPGTVLEYRALAVDTRPNQPNITTTPWQALSIDASAAPRPQQPPPQGRDRQGDDARGDGGRDGASSDAPSGRERGGAGKDAAENQADRRGEPGERSAADESGRMKGDPGDTMPRDGERGQGDTSGAPEAGKEASAGEKKPGGQKTGDQPPGAAGQRGRQQEDGAKPDSPPQDAGKQGEPKPGDTNGAAEGGKQGSKQPQAGGDTQRGGSQGQPRDQGESAGDGRSPAANADGKQAGGKQPGGGTPGAQDGSKSNRSGDRPGGKDAGKDGGERGPATSGQRSSQSGQSADGQAPGAKSNGRSADGGEAVKQPRPAVAADGTNDGEAMERILENRRREQGKAGGAQDAAGGKQGEGKQGEGKQGEGKQGEGKQGEGASRAADDTAKQAGDQPGGRQQPQGENQSSPAGGGAGAEGGAIGGQSGATAAKQPPREMEWGQQDLENARNAADLAIEHLRDAVARGNTDVLDDLGWTRDQARAFLDRWETMRRLAESPDPRQRGEFERVMRSLGLRPSSVRSSREVPADAKGGQAEGRRSRPPGDYRERFKAFLQGAGGE